MNFLRSLMTCTLSFSLLAAPLPAIARTEEAPAQDTGSDGIRISREAFDPVPAVCAEPSASPAALSQSQTLSRQSSRGFFESCQAWEAVEILDSLFCRETDLAAANDATNLENMLISLDIIEDANTLRRSLGKSEYRITHSAMAFAQARANWSYDHKQEGHAPRPLLPNGTSFPAGMRAWSENLDNYGDPRLEMTGAESLRVPRNSFDPWFYYEKAIAEGRIPGEDIGHYENLLEDYGYTGAAFVKSSQSFYTVPAGKWGTCIQNFYRFDPVPDSYTVDEYRALLQNYIRSVSQEVQGISMYRLYNPHSGEHHYTCDLNERNYLGKVGWKDEGYTWTAPQTSSIPVYRLYNPHGGDHHYTTDAKEYRYLIQAGWKDEKIGWYSDSSSGTPLYRLYNPNAKTGSHHFTTSTRERDFLKASGWKDEGIAWYGME